MKYFILLSALYSFCCFCQPNKPFVDPLFSRDTLLRNGTYFVLYHLPKSLSCDSAIYTGRDEYLISNNMLIESSRINPRINASVLKKYDPEDGSIYQQVICSDTSYCIIIDYYPNGEIMLIKQLGVGGFEEGYKFMFDENGILKEKVLVPKWVNV